MRSADLRQVELFRELDDGEIERLAQDFVELAVPADCPIFQEGEPLEAFYVVKEGAVVVYRDAIGKPVQLLARLGRHDFFGELALFHHVDSTISARTTEASRLLKIHRDALLTFLEGHPAITLRLQMAAAKRHTINAAAALELGQRNEVRIRVDREVELHLKGGGSRVAVLDNLSPGGLSLKGIADAWSEGEDIAFELRLKECALPCRGRVAWIRGDLVGVAFTATSDEHESRVQELLRRLFASRGGSASSRRRFLSG